MRLCGGYHIAKCVSLCANARAQVNRCQRTVIIDELNNVYIVYIFARALMVPMRLVNFKPAKRFDHPANSARDALLKAAQE